ncbi:MAG: YafY family transcriptional regulator [Gaiellaceae bacterium MAG52_C11]|nr:YafY family transcriptional regulator [Candidatus Gaiellasilicea maunaloa]
MASPTSRLLELLELLQARPLTTGREVADLLGIDARTVRRYIGILQELGIPVEGQRGVGGGYRIRPGYRLPPLMLSDEEAVVVVLGLLATRRSGPDGASAAVDGALAKINRVLPSTLRRQVEALEETLAFTAATGGAPADSAAVLLLADVIRRRRRLRTAYRSFSGEESERELSPHGLVVHSGRWYLAAYDHLRNDLRTFRVDRMWRIELADGAAVSPPEGFGAVTHVTRSLAGVPWRWSVEVLLDLPIDQAVRRIPVTLAELVGDPGGTLVRMRVDSLDWMATLLAGLGCDFAIHRPDELRASVRALAERLTAQV